MCHKQFRTDLQAKAFIEDWKDSFADVCRRSIRAKLDDGFSPNDMELSIKKMSQAVENNGGDDILDIGKLSIKRP